MFRKVELRRSRAEFRDRHNIPHFGPDRGTEPCIPWTEYQATLFAELGSNTELGTLALTSEAHEVRSTNAESETKPDPAPLPAVDAPRRDPYKIEKAAWCC